MGYVACSLTEKPVNEFKLIVAGGRDFDDYVEMHAQVMKLATTAYRDHEISIVSGMARGADALAVRFANVERIQLYKFPADWDKYGKRAGFLRNEEMAKFSDGLLAFWDGQSRGTAHMIKTMQAMGKPVHVVRYEPEIDTSAFPTQNI